MQDCARALQMASVASWASLIAAVRCRQMLLSRPARDYATAPRLSVDSAATLPVTVRSRLRSHSARNAPLKASPAPVASTMPTVIDGETVAVRGRDHRAVLAQRHDDARTSAKIEPQISSGDANWSACASSSLGANIRQGYSAMNDVAGAVQ